jgi:hypothetical protein
MLNSEKITIWSIHNVCEYVIRNQDGHWPNHIRGQLIRRNHETYASFFKGEVTKIGPTASTTFDPSLVG